MSLNCPPYTATLTQLNTSFSIDTFEFIEHGFSKNYQIILKIDSPQFLCAASLLQQPLKIHITGTHSDAYWHGIVTEVTQLGITADQQYQYTLLIQSPLGLLQYVTEHRTFLNCSIIDVVSQLLNTTGINYQFRTTQTYPIRDLITQCNETNYTFFCRLLNHWGLFFTFIQTLESCQLLIVDNIQEIPEQIINLTYQELNGMHKLQESAFSINLQNQVLTKNICLRDYNPQQPDIDLAFDSTQRENKFISSYGDLYYYDQHFINDIEAELLLNARQQALDWQRHTIILETDCPNLQPGQIISLTHCPQHNWNKNYRIISLTHTSNQCHATASMTYRNQVLCIPADVSYRTPIISNSLQQSFSTAHIASPTDSIYLDESGHYRTRFAFDRNQESGAETSPSIRLVQPYSGMDFGFHAPLYPDTEVLYTYSNGNPDRPLLLGTLSNSYMPSIVTAKNSAQNLWHTQGKNFLLLDDDKNKSGILLTTSEQQNFLHLESSTTQQKIRLSSNQGAMKIQALKNFNLQSDNYQHFIGNDYHVTIANQQNIITKNGNIEFLAASNLKVKAKNDINFSTEHSMNLESKQNSLFLAEQNAYWQTQNNLHFTAQGTLCMKAKQTLSIAAPLISIAQSGAQIQIQADGSIYIQANHIDIISQ